MKKRGRKPTTARKTTSRAVFEDHQKLYERSVLWASRPKNIITYLLCLKI